MDGLIFYDSASIPILKNMLKKTITIGIPAYNEEKNIQWLLKSILIQKEEGFSLEKIIVIIDGATDNTFAKASLVKSNKITIISSNQRLGKTARINELIELFSTDILV